MTNDLQKLNIDELQSKLPLPVSTCIEIVYNSVSGKLTSPESISAVYNIPLKQSLQLITNPVFSVLVHNMMIMVQRYKFDSVAMRKLMQIIEFGDDDRAKIQAVKVASDILGVNKSKDKQNVTLNMNFDSTVRSISDKTFPGL